MTKTNLDPAKPISNSDEQTFGFGVITSPVSEDGIKSFTITSSCGDCSCDCDCGGCDCGGTTGGTGGACMSSCAGTAEPQKITVLRKNLLR